MSCGYLNSCGLARDERAGCRQMGHTDIHRCMYFPVAKLATNKRETLAVLVRELLHGRRLKMSRSQVMDAMRP